MRIARWLIIDQGLAWPKWALPLHVVPAETIEELVIRAVRLDIMERSPSPLRDIRTSFDALIQLPFDTPVWLYQIRARWLLVQKRDYVLELWDMDHLDAAEPLSTFLELEGWVNGIETTSLANNVEVTLSTSSYRTYIFMLDLPFKAEVRPCNPSLTPTKSFDSYSSLKAKYDTLLGFSKSIHQKLAPHMVDVSTLAAALLESANPPFKMQSTLDIMIREDITVVARQRTVEIYSTQIIQQALLEKQSHPISVLPIQSFSHPGRGLVDHLTVFSHCPPCFNASKESIAMVDIFGQSFWASILSPQRADPDPYQRDYTMGSVYGVEWSGDVLYGVDMGEQNCRLVTLCDDRLSFHFARFPDRFDERGEVDDSHSLVEWRLPDSDADIPRPGCVAMDEATGVCVIGMGSGRIFVGDVVPRSKLKEFITPPLANDHISLLHPDPRWPELPSTYFWDGFYTGTLSDADPLEEVVPGWSTAIDHYFPWRNAPKAYGGILWFVTEVMGLPGPAKVVLFSTRLLSRENRDDSKEIVDVNGTLFVVNNARDESDVYVRRLVEGTKLEDVIRRLSASGTFNDLVVHDENWIYDYTPLSQHWLWYSMSGRKRSC